MNNENLKFVVKKDIPLKPVSLKKGEIIDNNYLFFDMLDVSDNNFFEKYVEPKYHIGQDLLYSSNKYSPLRYTVSRIYNGSYTLSRDGSANIVITDKTVGVKIPTDFWFINSNGQICPDYEERRDINKDGLEYKKRTNNYFKNIDDAREYRALLLNSISTNVK